MTTTAPEIEIVALATDQAATLDALVERLHAHLSANVAPPWTLTIVDYASHDDTFAVAQQLVGRFISTRAVQLPERMDRKSLRQQWGTSASTTVAFLELAPDRDLERQLAPLTRPAPEIPAVDDDPDLGGARQFSRRKALFAVGGVSLLALAAACGKAATTAATTAATAAGSSPTTTSGATSSSTTAASSAAATSGTVVLAPEMTEGPYYLDLDLVRSNIVEDRTGAALALSLVVIDVTTQKPIQGAAVDIWHADANGAYSGFVSASASANGGAGASSSSGKDTSTFLRGTQLTDASGAVTFATIYPGWYTGRTVHIHVKVHVSGKEIHTGQLFFDDSFTDTLFASTSPYSSRGTRNTRNANDSIFAGGGAQSTLVVAKTASGYASTINMGVKSA